MYVSMIISDRLTKCNDAEGEMMVSQWVSDEMCEQSTEQVNVWNYESEWDNEDVCELMGEYLLSKLIRKRIYE